MTIHEMLQQVALFSSGRYRREKDVSSLEIPLPDGRRQVIYGRIGVVRGEKAGILSTYVGECGPGVDFPRLLSINASLRYSRIALLEGEMIGLIAFFEPAATSIRECAPILQEMAAVADELERAASGRDER
ncbi:MAG: hypothetical protein QHI48_07305 [Bacteroidota bacterium]|nr:hypothetical protein [Bacteroidota bacterium]